MPGPYHGQKYKSSPKLIDFFASWNRLANASWHFMAKIKWPRSTPELPFPGPWPVNTSSLTAAWPAVEQALNESCWFWFVKNPKLEPGRPREPPPAHPAFPWFDFLRSRWRICSRKFSLQVQVLQLISGPHFWCQGKHRKKITHY